MATKKKLYISFILDETGSMECVIEPTISGFNEYTKNLKNSPDADRILFTLTQFNSEKVETVYDNVSIRDVEDRNRKNYHPANMTPLYDAIGKTISSIEKGVTGKKQGVLVIIQTDGEENVSKEYTRKSIFNKIDEKKKLGWSFVFLGANQDAWVADAIGIPAGNFLSYGYADTIQAFAHTSRGTAAYLSNAGIATETFYEGDTLKDKK